MADGNVLLQVEGVVLDYELPRQHLLGPRPRLRALDGVSFSVARGESFGLVGESGCGKSSLARVIMALQAPGAGRVLFQGHDLYAQSPAALLKLRRGFQMVFQDPYGSLDPRHSVAWIVAEPLLGQERRGAEARRDQVEETLRAVGLKAGDALKFPHEFSGGQRQRIAIARALITRPALLVADEPVSALDVSVQAQVLNLMMALRKDFGLSYLFISHDLAVVSRVTDRVAVMFEGRLVETGPTAELFAAPAHPYTKALLEAVPGSRTPGRRRRPKSQSDPVEAPGGSQAAKGLGCAYAQRCSLADARCLSDSPLLRDIGNKHRVACHHSG
jgi:peptide/nickel transport system ATP-binding protein